MIHAQYIIHRNLTLKNIFIDKDKIECNIDDKKDDNFYAVIGGFGKSRQTLKPLKERGYS